jgi:hypothetical protein
MRKNGGKITTMVPIREVAQDCNRNRLKDFRDRQCQSPRPLYRKNGAPAAVPLDRSSERRVLV